MEIQEMVQAVKAHAAANYNKGGWDIIVECWEDADIAEKIVGCRSVGGAIKKIGQYARAMGGYRAEIQAEAW